MQPNQNFLREKKFQFYLLDVDLIKAGVNCKQEKTDYYIDAYDFQSCECIKSIQSICYLVEIEDQVELTDIVEKLIEHLHKVVNGLQVSQVVVAHINADTEIKSCVAPVHDLEVPELKQN